MGTTCVKQMTMTACCAVLLMLASCWGSGLSEDSEGKLAISGSDYSSITVVCAPCTEALMVDSKGRRAGLDVGNGKTYMEIPNSSYMPRYHTGPSGASLPDIKHIYVGAPANENYRLTVTPMPDTVNDQFSSHAPDIRCYCPEYEEHFQSFNFLDVHMPQGRPHGFVIHFDKTPNGRCFVTGGLEGGGESVRIDQLLSYVNINKSKTQLPPGTDSTDLFIIYSDAILAESFEATLNDQDISNLFTPTAGGHEVVRLPIADGKNMLTLSVRESGTEEETTDIDKLEFRVE